MPHIPPPLPWTPFATVEPGSQYLVVLTTLPVAGVTRLPRFLSYTRRIQKQLDAAPPGMIGYSLLAKPLRGRYWTLSAWRDADALRAFIREPPHVEAMRALANVLSRFATVRWMLDGSEVPPPWDDALARERGPDQPSS